MPVRQTVLDATENRQLNRQTDRQTTRDGGGGGGGVQCVKYLLPFAFGHIRTNDAFNIFFTRSGCKSSR